MNQLFEYRCRYCENVTELRRVPAQRNQAAFCDDCARWSGRRILSVPVIRGATVSKS